MLSSVTYLATEVSSSSTDDRYAGIRALWLKVIIRAVFDWVSYRDSSKLVQRKLAENAYVWLFKPSNLFNSFENLCTMLDICPERIRRWAKSLSRDQIAKIEHLDRFPGAVDARILLHVGTEGTDEFWVVDDEET